MATTWLDIYTQVAAVLLEDFPPGFSLGVFTDAEFYEIAAEILLEFLSKGGLIKKVFNLPLQLGIAEYIEPDQLGLLESVVARSNYLYRTSGYSLDNTSSLWITETGTPAAFKEDEVPPKTVEVIPIPSAEGNQVLMLLGSGGYGVLAATSNVNDFDIQMQLGFTGFGIPSVASGNPYVETRNPGYGLIAEMIPSTGNLEMFGTAIPANLTTATSGLSGNSLVEGVPDSFVPYLKYGILARIFTSDSELRDQAKASYAQARFSEGIAIAQALMSEDYTEN